VYDAATGETTRIASRAAEVGSEAAPVFTGDGDSLVFTSGAAGLVAADTDRYLDLFAYDLASGRVDLITANTPDGDAGTLHAATPGSGSVVFVNDDAIHRWDTGSRAITATVPTTGLSWVNNLAPRPGDAQILFTAADRTGWVWVYAAVEHVNDIAVDLTGTVAGDPGGARTLTYAVDVTNSGPDEATTVTVALVMPAGAQFSSATGANCWRTDLSRPWLVGCDVGRLASGATRSVTITGTLSTPASTLAAVAVAQPTGLDPAGADNSAVLELDGS
jgi:uncharacterized repeat protein (TIGR01451 family)